MVNRQRSTEQRYKKHRQQNNSGGCDFCKFTADSSQVKEAAQSFWVVDNLFPYEIWDGHQVADHLMITPKRHVEGLAEFDAAERQEAMELLAKYEAQGYSIYARALLNKQKTVPHQHTHLIKLRGRPKRFQVACKKPYVLWTV